MTHQTLRLERFDFFLVQRAIRSPFLLRDTTTPLTLSNCSIPPPINISSCTHAHTHTHRKGRCHGLACKQFCHANYLTSSCINTVYVLIHDCMGSIHVHTHTCAHTHTHNNNYILSNSSGCDPLNSLARLNSCHLQNPGSARTIPTSQNSQQYILLYPRDLTNKASLTHRADSPLRSRRGRVRLDRP